MSFAAAVLGVDRCVVTTSKYERVWSSLAQMSVYATVGRLVFHCGSCLWVEAVPQVPHAVVTRENFGFGRIRGHGPLAPCVSIVEWK